MFDIAFTELAIIGAAALIFIGPERLPKVARMAGSLLGRAQRYLNDVKSEVQREMELDELRKLQQEMQEAASNVGQTISQSVSEAESEMQSAWNATAGNDTGSISPLTEPPSADRVAEKAKNFRKKRLARSSAVPSWYKQQTGQKSRVISGAARVARHRPAGRASKASPFFQ